jgi:lipoprotein-anchoring transpeptidase ErfK/SrfK
MMTRRTLVIALPLLVAGCATPQRFPLREPPGGALFADDSRYGAVLSEPFPIPALDLASVDPALLRREIAYAGPHRPGTIVVNVGERRLYLVLPGRRALRYAVGVGREEALNFRGAAVIGRKEAWPRWTPTTSMVQRIPRYRKYVAGMPGGLENPLGARALYLYRGNQDTYFRLHGTNEPDSIGNAVSSGCIRLFNQDIIDLYNRVPIGASVVVLQ